MQRHCRAKFLLQFAEMILKIQNLYTVTQEISHSIISLSKDLSIYIYSPVSTNSSCLGKPRAPTEKFGSQAANTRTKKANGAF